MNTGLEGKSRVRVLGGRSADPEPRQLATHITGSTLRIDGGLIPSI
jgi:hypothetical protein